MVDPFRHLRGTGRTTRLCREALRVATQEHRPVIIWCATLRCAEQILLMMNRMTDIVITSQQIAPSKESKLGVARKTSFGFRIEIGQDRLDIRAASVTGKDAMPNLYEDPTLIGADTRTVYFADHHLVEMMAPWLVTQWEQFR